MPFAVIGGERIKGDFNTHLLRIVGRDDSCLLKGRKPSELLFQAGLRAGNIDLQNLSCRHISNIHDIYGKCNGSVFVFRSLRLKIKLRIGESVSETVTDGDPQGIKVTVSHVYAFIIFFRGEILI